MKFYLSIIGSLALLVSGFAAEEVAQDVEVYGEYDDGDDGEYDDGLYWTGPGWYGGVWFDSELEFNGWHDHHHRSPDTARESPS